MKGINDLIICQSEMVNLLEYALKRLQFRGTEFDIAGVEQRSGLEKSFVVVIKSRELKENVQ